MGIQSSKITSIEFKTPINHTVDCHATEPLLKIDKPYRHTGQSIHGFFAVCNNPFHILVKPMSSLGPVLFEQTGGEIIQRSGSMEKNDITRLELDLLIKAIDERYDYDFSHYARSSFRRRVEKKISTLDIEHISQLIPLLLHDRDFFNDLLRNFSITVTEMFRDPEFFKDIRTILIPKLKTYPFIRIWHAGCATGEEVYSMAIMLKEADLLDHCQIYATDYNCDAIKIAERGIYPLELMAGYSNNYHKAGGIGEFSDHYRSQYQSAKFHDSLKKNITFANHNLVSDGVFGEMHVIICRNVMIYFDPTLQNHVYTLFRDSLVHRGFLCLGSKDSVDYSSVAEQFETLSGKNRIFQKLPVSLADSGLKISYG